MRFFAYKRNKNTIRAEKQPFYPLFAFCTKENVPFMETSYKKGFLLLSQETK